MLISFALAHCLQVVCCPEPLSKVSASFLSIFFKVKVLHKSQQLHYSSAAESA